jgi:molecular chaperone GrpE
MTQDPNQHPESSPEPDANDPLAPENVESLADYDDQEADDEDILSPTQKRVVELEVELAQAKDKMLRVAAEAENTKRRALNEKEDARKYATSNFARDLLSVADNMRRALDSVKAETNDSDQLFRTVVEGIQFTEQALLKAFESNGIKPIDPIDELFNPNFHEVMFETPMPGKQPGTVIEVIELGYILNDRLLRPARVGVAKSEETSPGAQLDEQV